MFWIPNIRTFSNSTDLVTKPTSSSTLSWRDTAMGSGNGGKIIVGSFTNSQNRAILIAALSCAAISFLLVLISLRWFLIMRRSFRHRLVLHLIISDTLKAIWYFMFPMVVFSRGPVNSTSNFCQASGYLLAFAIEASDMAIFIIALHATLCILRPNNTAGEGGLYRYRNWIYPLWLGPPFLAASLAFVNSTHGYTTAGTFCYLPKRPFWYRLALAWVPRYMIISLILIMYIWIYVYVHVKFRGFDNLRGTDSSYDSELKRKSGFSTKTKMVERRGTEQSEHTIRSSVFMSFDWQPQYQTSETPQQLEPWDHMNFITARPLETPLSVHDAEQGPADTTARGSDWSCQTHIAPVDANGQAAKGEAPQPRRLNCSDEPATIAAQHKNGGGAQGAPNTTSLKGAAEFADPLRRTRIAIRKQLRYLFIYPLVYIIMWSFPFASHALSYNDYYVQHPVFWLSIIQTVMVALQAGADSIMFSCSEKPWRRVDANSKFSMPFLRRRSIALLRRCSLEQPVDPIVATPTRQPPSANQNPTWWEAEGRRRNDSVWMGTNTTSQALSSITTRTRSRSPHKQRQGLHSRGKSSEQGMGFVPRLEPILPATGDSPAKRAISPKSSKTSIREPLDSSAGHSLQPVHEDIPTPDSSSQSYRIREACPLERDVRT